MIFSLSDRESPVSDDHHSDENATENQKQSTVSVAFFECKMYDLGKLAYKVFKLQIRKRRLSDDSERNGSDKTTVPQVLLFIFREVI